MIAKRFRGVASVAIAGLVIAVAAGCAPAADDSGSGETSLTIALADDYNTLDPALASTAAGYSLLMSLYDRLVVLDADGQIAPSLASEWEATPEVITFTLRDDITCSDGSEVTATQVAASLSRLADPETASPHRNRTFGTGDVTVTGDDATGTVTVQNSLPFNDMILGLTAPWAGITCGAGNSDPSTLDDAPTGTGPYTLSADGAMQGSQYTLERRDEYTGNPYGLSTDQLASTITYRVITDPGTTTNELLSGGIDLGAPLPSDYPALEAAPELTKNELSVNGSIFLYFRQADGAPLADANVRKAITETFDLGEAVAVGSGGTGVQGPSWLAPTVQCAGGTESVLPTGDTTRAEQLLTDAGYARGADGIWAKGGAPLTLTLVVAEEEGQGAEFIASEMTAFGIDLVIDQRTFGETLDTMAATSNWDIGVFPYGPPIGTPSSALGYFLSAGATNWAGVNNAEFDALATQAISAPPESDERCDLWEQAQASAVGNADLLPLWTPAAFWFSGSSIANPSDLRSPSGYSIDPASIAVAG
jgi:peptide/nickel transport system substrate-binding protein